MKNNTEEQTTTDKKVIVMGETGSGKSYKALEIALKNRHEIVIANGCAGIDCYIKSFPKLSEFSPMDITLLGRECAFYIEKNQKYFLEGDKISYEKLKKELPFFVRQIVFCDEGLCRDENATIVFDDGIWHYQPYPSLMLSKLGDAKCGVIITVESWGELLGKADADVSDEEKRDIENFWTVIKLERKLRKEDMR